MWKKISSKIVYETPWIKVQEDEVIQPDGKQDRYTFLNTPESCMIIAWDKKSKSLFLINEFRYPIGRAIWQFPSGVIEDGLEPLENAQKELIEETGINAKEWKELRQIYSFPGKTTNLLHIFLASDLDLSEVKINQEGNESICEIRKFKISEIKKMIKDGTINSSETLAALMIFFDYRNKIGIKFL